MCPCRAQDPRQSGPMRRRWISCAASPRFIRTLSSRAFLIDRAEQPLAVTGLRPTASRILRNHWGIPCFQREPEIAEGDVMTIAAAAAVLNVVPSTLHRWLNEGLIAGEQVTAGAPWRIRMFSAKAFCVIFSRCLVPCSKTPARVNFLSKSAKKSLASTLSSGIFKLRATLYFSAIFFGIGTIPLYISYARVFFLPKRAKPFCVCKFIPLNSYLISS